MNAWVVKIGIGLLISVCYAVWKFRPQTTDVPHEGPYGNFDGSSINTCVLCLKQFQDNYGVIALPCLHKYHKECIKELFSYEAQKTCPVCRQQVSNAFLSHLFGI